MEIPFSGKCDLTRAKNFTAPWNRRRARACRSRCQPHVNAKHGSMRAAVELRVLDCVADFGVQQPTECVCLREVTAALLLRCNALIKMVVDVTDMKTTKSMRVRASRFFTDRYAYRAQPNYSSELVAFGLIVVTAIWPIFLLANAMAAAPR